MTKYWEIDLFLFIGILIILWLLILLVRDWLADRARWSMPRHLGTTYDASVKFEPRPNIRRA